MISTLLITIVTEGLIALGYCTWKHKPINSILLTILGANFLTQLLLWGSLILFFRHYLITLLTAEVLIWLVEGLALHGAPGNQLRLTEALILSLSINLVSFVIGWLLPL